MYVHGIRGLYRTAEADGVFCYTFFKGVGVGLTATDGLSRDVIGRQAG